MRLSPSQQTTYDAIIRELPAGHVFVVWTPPGLGRTTILRQLHERTGGAFLNMKDVLDALREQDPLAIEETFMHVVLGALAKHDAVIVDDLHRLDAVVCCNSFYPRVKLLHAPLDIVSTYAVEKGKKLIFGSSGAGPGPIQERAHHEGYKKLTPADYAALLGIFLGEETAGALDVAKIHRFAPRLSAHTLRTVARELPLDGPVTTARLIEYLRTNQLSSNVDLGEVQAVDLSTLKGIDDIVASLEANIVVPLENDALAAELGIKPKRGVLIVGPPGTGKTTVGRALAHRLQSKFFLIDGTFISGTRNFYEQIHRVFEAAKLNAPSIIFIDDSDVIFENGKEHGLYRYLLTMLDGLESESAGRVCVMLTAMDVGAMPPALIRSGRIELWLETRLPDAEARSQILQELAAKLSSTLAGLEVARIVEATDGLTGADMKRLVEDGKILYAFDRARGKPLRPVTEYFLAAVATVRENGRRYAEAEARIRAQPRTASPEAGYVPDFEDES